MIIKDESPRISIVMPSFNQAQFLEEAITSVLDQGYRNLEFLVIDGGSTDGSRAILEKYASSFEYWCSRPDGGQIDALTRGFAMATGDLLGWLNSDDVLLPGALWAMATAHIRRPEAGLVGGNYILIDAQGRIVRCKRHPAQASFLQGFGLTAINQPGSLFTREAFDAVHGLDSRFDLVMDTDLYFRILASGSSYLHVNGWLGGFRIHSEQKTTVLRQRADAERREAVAGWFPSAAERRIRLALAPGAYHLLQVLNANYLRSTYETALARGVGWRRWAAAHCRPLRTPPS